MRLITKKSKVKILLKKCLNAYHKKGINGLRDELSITTLAHKVKFPLLEYCAREIFNELDENEHIKVETLKTEGGNVILGIILQERLMNHYEEVLIKATEYIPKATIWYVCDIIGERVFGHALLHYPDKTIPEVELLLKHPNQWVVRSLGAGIHYSIKKGIGEHNVQILFSSLLNLAKTTNKEIRQGIGWAAKTTAKFHQYHRIQ